MSIKVSTYVWDGFPGGGSKMLVMLALADWCNDEGGSLYPSVPRVADKTRLSERQVQRILRELEEDNFIHVVGNHDGGKPGTTRLYHLDVERLKALADHREFLRLQARVTSTSPLPKTGDTDVTTGVSPMSPYTLDEPSESTSTRGRKIFKTSTTECKGGPAEIADDERFPFGRY